MKKKSTLNVALLKKVKEHILENPARLRMSNWVVNRQILKAAAFAEIINNKFVFEQKAWDNKAQTIPACGTVGCIAGWTVIIGNKLDPEKADVINAQRRATALLNISENDASDLFFVDSWPSEYEEPYLEAESQEERAQIVAKVIDDFIAKHK
jgi:hypothetical protein